MNKLTLIIYALPGGGKGTQGKILKDKYDTNYLCSGDIIRMIKEENTTIGRQVKERYDKGIPQPDEVILEIFRLKMLELVRATGNKKFVIDGFPKTIHQADSLEEICDELEMSKPYFIYLDVPENEVIKRISNRRFCKNCGTSYLPSQIEYNKMNCSKCDKRLSVRDDDKAEILMRRIQEENKRIGKLTDYYQNKDRLITINGKPSVLKVADLIVQSLMQKGII